jgi:hypothetical protein
VKFSFRNNLRAFPNDLFLFLGAVPKVQSAFDASCGFADLAFRIVFFECKNIFSAENVQQEIKTKNS